MAVKNLLIRGGADFSGIKKEMDKTQKTLSNFQSNVGGTMKKIGALLGGLAIGKFIKDSTSMAMGVESATDNISRNMGQSSKVFSDWVKTQAWALGIAKADAYKYGSTFSNLLASFTKSAKETADQTTELMKAAAIIASKTGRSYEDTAERIRSGMLGSTEAIEDLGVYTNISMIESTNAFKRFANGKSWAQLDFQTQQQIRLAAILEQTYARYGNELANTAQTTHAQFIASLKNIQLAIGQAFMPIYSFVLPALTALANAIGTVFNYIAQFTTALFGKAADTQKQAQATAQQAKATSGLGGAIEKAGKQAKKAGKEAKGALASFDEINNISNKSPSGDYDGGGGAGADMPAMAEIGPMPIDFTTNAPEVSSVIQEMASNVKSVLATVFEPFKRSWEIYGKDILLNVNIVFLGIKEIALRLGETLYNIWTNPAVQNSVILLVGIFTDLFTILTRIFNEMIKPIVLNFLDLLDPTKNPAAQGFLDKIQEVLGGVKNLTEYLAGDGFKYVQAFLELFMAFKAAQFVMEMTKNTIALITNTKAWIANTVEMVKNTVLRAKDFIASLISSVVNIYKNIAALVAEELAMSGATLGQYALNLAMSLNPIALVIIAVMGLVGAIVILYNKFEWFRDGVKWIVNGIISGINKLIDGLNKIKFDLPSWIPGIGGKSFGINIPRIPMLAQGGYVKANSPTLAMIGDNKTEGEIVAPESKIYEQTYKAISDALKQNGNGADKPMNLTIQFGSTRVFKAIIDGINQVNKEAGENLIII